MGRESSFIPNVETRRQNRTLLLNSSVEIFPSPSVGERVVNLFGGSGRKITVTSSPSLSIETTLELSSFLVRNGFEVVPHIAAQSVSDRNHLEQVYDKVLELGVKEVFFVKGDGVQKGTYKTSAQLMNDLANIGARFAKVGIAGYPEGLSGMTEEQLTKGIKVRQETASRMGADLFLITQMCFDADIIEAYIGNLRLNGIAAPVVVGLPAPQEKKRLYETAIRCRVGESKERIMQITQEEYLPQDLVDQIRALGINVEGYHIYSFNRVQRLSRWFFSLNEA